MVNTGIKMLLSIILIFGIVAIVGTLSQNKVNKSCDLLNGEYLRTQEEDFCVSDNITYILIYDRYLGNPKWVDSKNIW